MNVFVVPEVGKGGERREGVEGSQAERTRSGSEIYLWMRYQYDTIWIGTSCVKLCTNGFFPLPLSYLLIFLTNNKSNALLESLHHYYIAMTPL